MGQQSNGGIESPELIQRLLLSTAEQLKLPYLQLARSAEILSRTYDEPVLQAMQTTADSALQLLDNYLFGARLAMESTYQLTLEPVSVSSVLYDTGQQLDAMAKLYGVELRLEIGGKFGPVFANRQALQSALVSLGYTLIEALPNLDSERPQLSLSLHRCRYGLVAGMYSKVEQLTAEALRMGRKLQGHSRQPLTTVTYGSGAGLFVADAILQAMHATLKPTRWRTMHGLGTILPPSPQVQLL